MAPTTEDQRGPGQVRAEEDLPPRPPVEQYAGERPEDEYGSSATANSPAIAAASGARSGENSTYDASATWNTPSPNCDVSRTANTAGNPPASAASPDPG